MSTFLIFTLFEASTVFSPIFSKILNTSLFWSNVSGLPVSPDSEIFVKIGISPSRFKFCFFASEATPSFPKI